MVVLALALLKLEFVSGDALKFIDLFSKTTERMMVCDVIENLPVPVKVSGINAKDLMRQWARRSGGSFDNGTVGALSHDEFSASLRSLEPSATTATDDSYARQFPDRTIDLVKLNGQGEVVVHRLPSSFVSLGSYVDVVGKRRATVDELLKPYRVAISGGTAKIADLTRAVAYAVGGIVVKNRKNDTWAIKPDWERLRLRWYREAMRRAASEDNPFFAAKAEVCMEAVKAISVADLERCLRKKVVAVSMPVSASEGVYGAVERLAVLLRNWDALYPKRKEFGQTLQGIVSDANWARPPGVELYSDGHASIRIWKMDGSFVVL